MNALVPIENLLLELRNGKTTKMETSRRLELWETLKMRVFVRTFLSLYASSLLHLLVHLQLFLLGRDLQTTSSSHPNNNPPQDADTYLKTNMDYFFSEGMPRLVAHIEAVLMSDKEFLSWTVHVKDTLSSSAFLTCITRLHEALTPSPLSEPVDATLVSWRGFIMQTSTKASIDSFSSSPALKHLMDQTRDVLSTPAFTQALIASLSEAYSQTVSTMTLGLFDMAEVTTSRPLVKLIPALEQTTVALWINPSETMTTALASSSAFQKFCDTVFHTPRRHRTN